jgi:hypothetical protein
MPVLIVIVLIFILFGLIILSLPFSLFQRYRRGTARVPARGWIATINLFGFFTSAMILVIGAAATNFWVPRALLFTLLGFTGGALLGFVGLALTRWETTPRTLHYTPNRALVLSMMLLISARLIYGIWRGWNAWSATPDDVSWLAASGAAGSLGAGAVIIGYYLVFWAGVRRRAANHRLLTGTGRRIGGQDPLRRV